MNSAIIKLELKNLSEKTINIDDLKNQKICEVDELLHNNRWKDILPGRIILQNFLNEYNQNIIKWDAFRNLLINEIKNIGIPDDIKNVIETIRNS